MVWHGGKSPKRVVEIDAGKTERPEKCADMAISKVVPQLHQHGSPAGIMKHAEIVADETAGERRHPRGKSYRDTGKWDFEGLLRFRFRRSTRSGQRPYGHDRNECKPAELHDVQAGPG